MRTGLGDAGAADDMLRLRTPPPPIIRFCNHKVGALFEEYLASLNENTNVDWLNNIISLQRSCTYISLDYALQFKRRSNRKYNGTKFPYPRF